MLLSFYLETKMVENRKEAEDESLTAKILIMVPSVTYAGLVYVMNVYYRRLATYLTEWGESELDLTRGTCPCFFLKKIFVKF